MALTSEADHKDQKPDQSTAGLQGQVRLVRNDFTLRADIELPARGVTAIFGPSGCGKTSLLRFLAGLEPTAEGELHYNGVCWQDADQFVPAWRRPVGYVWQQGALFPHLTVAGNLQFAWRRSPQQHELAPTRVAKLTGIQPFLSRYPRELSGGQQQRVALARALCSCPQLLLLDEPLANLDTAARYQMLAMLRWLQNRLEIPMIYVSHQLDEVIQLADQLMLLAAGQVRQIGPLAAQLLTADATELTGGVSVVEGRVTGVSDELLATIQIGDQHLCLPVRRDDLKPGQACRIPIAARQLALSLAPQNQSSVQNQLPAEVIAVLAASHPAEQRVLLEVSGQRVQAIMTRQAQAQLRLQPGLQVWVQLKAAAVT